MFLFPVVSHGHLGNYTDEFGGVQARGKCTFGILVYLDKKEREEEEEEEEDEDGSKSWNEQV